MDRTNLAMIGALGLVAGAVGLTAKLTAPPPPAKGPSYFLHVVHGLGEHDRAWVDTRYQALPERLGLTPCGELAWPATGGSWTLAEGCVLSEGLGTPCAQPSGVQGTHEAWTVDLDGVWPVPAESSLDGQTLQTPRGDGFTLVGDGSRWCAIQWTTDPTELELVPTRRVDIQRTRRSLRDGVVLTWSAAER